MAYAARTHDFAALDDYIYWKSWTRKNLKNLTLLMGEGRKKTF